MEYFNKRKELNIMREQFSDNLEALQALGDTSRQNILIGIMQGEFGGSRVGEIAKRAHLSEPTVSHHLAILKRAGIIKSYSVGTKNYYYIDAASMKLKELRQMLTSFERVADQFAKIQNYEEKRWQDD